MHKEKNIDFIVVGAANIVLPAHKNEMHASWTLKTWASDMLKKNMYWRS